MIEPLAIPGAFRVTGRRAADDRGAFRKVLDAIADELPDPFRGFDEVAASHNAVAGTLRGLHYQVAPFEQPKTVWVAAGRIFDAFVDIRPESPAYGQSLSFEFGEEDAVTLLLPAGVAHGFQTLEDDTTVIYHLVGGYSGDHARTLAHDDPALGIEWPLPVTAISANDQNGLAWPVS